MNQTSNIFFQENAFENIVWKMAAILSRPQCVDSSLVQDRCHMGDKPLPESMLTHFTGASWWCHQMETFSALLAICAGNSPVHGEFPAQRPVTWSFDVFFDLRLKKWLSKQSWGCWFETLSLPLWRHRNVYGSLSQNVLNICGHVLGFIAKLRW